LQGDFGANFREWSSSRVAKYLADFAASNDLKLQSQGPQLLGETIWEFQPSSLFRYFEDASDIAVLDLYYQIHPTEVTSNSSHSSFCYRFTVLYLYV
jgi:hypothetical protein